MSRPTLCTALSGLTLLDWRLCCPPRESSEPSGSRGKDTKTSTDKDAVRHAAPRPCIVPEQYRDRSLGDMRQSMTRKEAARVNEIAQ
ncbi:uncharacterized protein CC84DRAFT_1159580 [Paraphaeosphaeria sporulosa]|uniref:Secreted protein n=1 Tax=Paraphaeosphaeria sporulosa TaxID=1460663 RepID=A0A177CZY0_9PLEO|nr:uncharacterized protein CC84DRAFT_1159580 [Paraphaeosphaeria sporulosa]OAG12239.1 hypothetical protein CC84DRAFT_1159580 [Paraphaeosphaeria sporulosa]